MKFKTFRAIVVTGVCILAAGAVVAGARASASGRAVRQVAEKTAPPASPPASTEVKPSAPAPQAPQAPVEGALRAMDTDILALLSRPMSGDRIKDAFPSRSYKVNVYKDEGFASANRLKIDFDRDEQDDEKWTIEGSGSAMTVKRQVSPKDDGNYPEEFRLVHGAWARKE